jgi:Domain of unknown function (DUF4397)
MKIKYSVFVVFLLTSLSTVFVACEKNVISMPGDTPLGAKVKFLPSCSNCPSLQMTANGQIINPTGVGYGGAFPTSGYAILPTGDVTLGFIRTDSSKSIFSTKVTLGEGKWYSVYLGDTIQTPSLSLIEDDIKPFQDTFMRVRFVNVLSGTQKDTLEFVRKNDNSVLASGITYGKASEFKFVPTTTADTFFYRKVGATAIYPLTVNSIITTKRTAQTITFLARGVNNKIGTSPQIPKIDFWVNR